MSAEGASVKGGRKRPRDGADSSGESGAGEAQGGISGSGSGSGSGAGPAEYPPKGESSGAAASTLSTPRPEDAPRKRRRTADTSPLDSPADLTLLSDILLGSSAMQSKKEAAKAFVQAWTDREAAASSASSPTDDVGEVEVGVSAVADLEGKGKGKGNGKVAKPPSLVRVMATIGAIATRKRGKSAVWELIAEGGGTVEAGEVVEGNLGEVCKGKEAAGPAAAPAGAGGQESGIGKGPETALVAAGGDAVVATASGAASPAAPVTAEPSSQPPAPAPISAIASTTPEAEAIAEMPAWRKLILDSVRMAHGRLEVARDSELKVDRVSGLNIIGRALASEAGGDGGEEEESDEMRPFLALARARLAEARTSLLPSEKEEEEEQAVESKGTGDASSSPFKEGNADAPFEAAAGQQQQAAMTDDTKTGASS